MEVEVEAADGANLDASNIVSDDDDESYVPDSLRDFLKAADKRLEEDLAGFLSPPESSNVPLQVAYVGDVDDMDDEDGDGGNSILAEDLEQEMKRAKQKDLERAAAMEQEMKRAKQKDLERTSAMEQESEDQKEREQKNVDHDELQAEQKKQKLEEESNNAAKIKAAAAAAAAVLEEDDNYDDEDEDADLNVSSPLLDIIHPSADVSKSHLKKIAMEGADQEDSSEEEALQPLVAMVEGNHPPALSPMMIGGGTNTAILTSGGGGGGTNTNTETDTPTANRNESGNGSAFSPSPASTKVGRKLQMELDAEAQRASLSSPSLLQTPKREELNNSNANNWPDDMDIDNGNSNSNNNNNVSFQESLDEKRKSMNEKKQRLKELKARSVERRTRLKEIDDEGVNGKKSEITLPIEDSIQKLSEEVAAVTQLRVPLPEHVIATGTVTVNGGDVTPSMAAAAAANKAAAVVANTATNTVANYHNADEGPIAMLDVDAALVATKESTTKTATATKTMPRKLAVTGPVKALASQQQPRQQQIRPKRSFRTRNPTSPPRPTEIITRTKFSEDGGSRSVSPLGGVDAMAMHDAQAPVSPLASPTTSYRRATTTQQSAAPVHNNYGAGRNYNDDDDKPMRPSPSRRRQLTKPDSAFDRLSRPTVASNASRTAGAARKQTPKIINPEDERRKARERIRKRMAVQRKKAKHFNDASQQKPTSHINTASGGGNANAAEKSKADARKERMERMEKERLAKFKAKIEAKEERMKLMKKNEETKKNKLRLKLRAAATTRQSNQPPEKEPENKAVRLKAQQPHQGSNKSALTIPIAPKFATDRRISLASNKKITQPKERLSLASITGMFGQGLRSSTPLIKKSTETPGPRRLTIPLAPKFATTQRFGDKANKTSSTPFASPSKKNKRRDSSDNVSWSSMLRDVSGIGSPVSKSASSVKTGPLTIPMTPQFQPIRKRPLPKSTAEREKEEMEFYKEHPFKARMVNMHQPISSSSSSRPKKPTPKRKLTTPEPFQFHRSSAHKHDHQEAKTEGALAASFKAMPMPNFSSKVSVSSNKIKSPRTLTKPEPFQFHSASSKRSNNAKSHEDEPTGENFKALPMPDFKSSRKSLGSKKTSPNPRTLTTPEPFQFHSTSSKRSSYSKSGEQPTGETFKAMPMPDFKSSRTSLGSKKLNSSPTRPLTTPEPFKFHGHSTSREHDEKSPEDGEAAGSTFKARPMPSFASHHKKSLLGSRPKSAKKLTSTEPFHLQQQKDDDRTKRMGSRSSNKIPTGASGLLFHRSFTASSRLSRPKVSQEAPKRESKPFRARPMPDFIPDVIVTRTPIKDKSERKQEMELELDSILSDDHPSSSFNARPMPDFDKVDIPVKEENPVKIRTPSGKTKEGESPVSSPVFKASLAPKNMLDEPSIPVRRRDPKKLRSPESVPKPTTPSSMPKSPTFRARPVPDSLYDEPSPIHKLRSPYRSAASTSRKTTLNSPVTSPPRIQREKESNSSNLMGDAKARLRERLSQRRSNAAAVKAATPDRDKSRNKNSNDNIASSTDDGDKILTSPKAFSTLRVQSLLNSHSQANAKREEQLQNSKRNNNNIDSADNTASGHKTPKKSNSTIPKSIDLPLRSASPKETNANCNANDTGVDPSKEADLLRETKLALALAIPDGDESSSILQLAQEVQKAAEDELSFYSTADTRDHWSSSLADGRPHDLL